MDKSRDVKEWLKRAKASLARAKMPLSGDMLYEDACFDCQQSAEKSLKALLIHLGLDFPRTHSFEKLLDILKKRIIIPENIYDVLDLSDYAVTTRYPDDYVEVTKDEYKEAVKIAETVYNWVLESINSYFSIWLLFKKVNKSSDLYLYPSSFKKLIYAISLLFITVTYSFVSLSVV